MYGPERAQAMNDLSRLAASPHNLEPMDGSAREPRKILKESLRAADYKGGVLLFRRALRRKGRMGIPQISEIEGEVATRVISRLRHNGNRIPEGLDSEEDVLVMGKVVSALCFRPYRDELGLKVDLGVVPSAPIGGTVAKMEEGGLLARTTDVKDLFHLTRAADTLLDKGTLL